MFSAPLLFLQMITASGAAPSNAVVGSAVDSAVVRWITPLIVQEGEWRDTIAGRAWRFDLPAETPFWRAFERRMRDTLRSTVPDSGAGYLLARIIPTVADGVLEVELALLWHYPCEGRWQQRGAFHTLQGWKVLGRWMVQPITHEIGILDNWSCA